MRSTVDLGTIIVELDQGAVGMKAQLRQVQERMGGEQKRQCLETCPLRSFVIKGSRELEECAVK